MVRTLLIASMFYAVWMPPLASIGGLSLRANQLVLAASVLYLILVRAKGAPRYSLPFFIVWCAFLFWTVLNALMDPAALDVTGATIGSIGRAFLVGVNLCAYGVAYLFVVRRGDAQPALDAIVVSGALMAVLGLGVFVATQRGIQLPEGFVSVGDEPVLRNGGLVSEEVTRLYGGPNKATFLAGITVMCLVLATDRHIRRRSRYVACGSLCAFGIFLGIARGAVLALGVGCVVVLLMLVARRGFSTLIRVVLIGVLTISLGWTGIRLMPDEDGKIAAAFLARFGQMGQLEGYSTGTAGQRLELWSLLLDDVRRHPLWGNGMDAYRKYYPEKTLTTENFLLEVLHATGLWGFLPLVGVIGAVSLRAWRMVHFRGMPGQPRAAVAALLAGYIGVLAGSLTNSLWGGGLFWTILGVLAGAVDVAAGHRRVVIKSRRTDPIPRPPSLATA